MTTPETEPTYGHVWINRKDGRQVFVERVANLCVELHYLESKRRTHKFLSDFKKQFRFSHVYMAPDRFSAQGQAKRLLMAGGAFTTMPKGQIEAINAFLEHIACL